MILGCGIDSVEIKRIEKLLQRFPHRFLERVFTASERKIGEAKLASERISYYAKRFTAKEAALKAMGLGLQKGLSWQDLTVSATSLGQPLLTLSAKGIRLLKQQHEGYQGIFRFHISLSDTKEYAQAMVILELS